MRDQLAAMRNSGVGDYNSSSYDPKSNIDAVAISKEYILNQGRFPQNSLRKPRVKKDATNLRGKGSQY